MKDKMKWTIGADPEFIIKNQKGNVVNANETSWANKCSAECRIGCDGSGRPLEIRPKPQLHTDIKNFYFEILDILNRVKNECSERNYIVVGGASDGTHRHNSIGGHIHVGYQHKKYGKDYFYFIGGLLNAYIIPIINNFLYRDELLIRYESGYGKSIDCREQPHGLEFRTPYSFLLNPTLTIGTYSLTALLLHNINRINASKLFYLNNRLSLYYKKQMCESFIHELYKKIKPDILRFMKNSPNPHYNSYILALFSLIEQRKKIRASTYNILEHFPLTGSFSVYHPPRQTKLIYDDSTGNRGIISLYKNIIEYLNKKINITTGSDIYIRMLGGGYINIDILSPITLPSSHLITTTSSNELFTKIRNSRKFTLYFSHRLMKALYYQIHSKDKSNLIPDLIKMIKSCAGYL